MRSVYIRCTGLGDCLCPILASIPEEDSGNMAEQDKASCADILSSPGGVSPSTSNHYDIYID